MRLDFLNTRNDTDSKNPIFFLICHFPDIYFGGDWEAQLIHLFFNVETFQSTCILATPAALAAFAILLYINFSGREGFSFTTLVAFLSQLLFLKKQNPSSRPEDLGSTFLTTTLAKGSGQKHSFGASAKNIT